MLSHVPMPKPKWQAILWPFDTYVWAGIIISVLIYAVVQSTLIMSNEKRDWNTIVSTLSGSLFVLLRIQLNEGTKVQYRRKL